jgi:ATP-dependent RNA helicase SUPV3L1/SUV3
VHLKEWNFASIADCRNAGYRKIGNEYVRIDLAERVIKKAHEARGEALVFGMDMAFATSLGLSEDGLQALMRDAGFRQAEAKVDEPIAESKEAAEPEAEVKAEAETATPTGSLVKETEVPAEVEPAEQPEAAVDAEPSVSAQPVNLTHWRWVGLRKAKLQPQNRSDRAKAKGKPKGERRPESSAPKPQQRSEPAAPSALALQLAALKEKMGR